MPHIHLIDDDAALHDLLGTYFKDSDWTLSGSETPSAAFAYLNDNAVDLVILDVMLPEMDGFAVCRELRQRQAHLPILMLTARGDDMNTILGLEMGADDYMSKPFNPRELEARIKTILRRIERYEDREPATVHEVYTSPGWDLSLNVDTRKVSLKGEDIELTATEFDLLKILMANPGRVLSRDALMQKLRGYDWEVTDRSVDMHVSKLRQKLGDPSRKPLMLKTVWGVGYVFSEPRSKKS